MHYIQRFVRGLFVPYRKCRSSLLSMLSWYLKLAQAIGEK
ncbi:hypothetical protein MNB_SV-6-102 [hydrothermal vent metagenome]|uniref:Uncharacterized protein n=1 Tax=hydrothermal vent metagenome TaxID=652676 RepID=A0A1W1BKN7_9ZZZZ